MCNTLLAISSLSNSGRTDIDDFLTVLPLLQELSKDSIQPRHWTEVMEVRHKHRAHKYNTISRALPTETLHDEFILRRACGNRKQAPLGLWYHMSSKQCIPDVLRTMQLLIVGPVYHYRPLFDPFAIHCNASRAAQAQLSPPGTPVGRISGLHSHYSRFAVRRRTMCGIMRRVHAFPGDRVGVRSGPGVQASDSAGDWDG